MYFLFVYDSVIVGILGQNYTSQGLVKDKRISINYKYDL